MMARRFLTATALLAGYAGAALASPKPWQLNMTPGVTEMSRQVYDLHMLILWICVVIGVLVFGAMAYAMFKFRKSKGAVPARWSHNTTAEIIWTVIPVLILVAMAWPATKTLIEMADTDDAELTVKITGYQWLWRYEYVGTDVNFVSKLDRDSDRTRMLRSGLDPAAVTVDGENTYLLNVDRPLVLPTDTKIRFVITANDVIHSWWVPVLGWKQDAIPGFINEAWTRIDTPGTYRGQCAELCGKDHGFMPIVVEAVPPAQFAAWLGETDAIAKAARAAEGAPAVAAASIADAGASAADAQ
ncbi:MAG: cytochrome c oxidase subunit II [Xanthomonadales bacterium]|nr:cytochrome c oxidase subunit II [Xanthomonadales bacterium]